MRNFLTSLAVAALFSCAALPAYAQLGSLLGALTDPVEDLVDDVLDDAEDTVGNTVNTVNNVQNTVNGVVNGVTGTVDDLLLGGGDPTVDYGFTVPVGTGGELPDTMIAQLLRLIEIIRAREWAQYGLAPARVGAIDLRRWIPEDNWADLNTVMVTYASDIMALQQSIIAGAVMPGWTGFRRLPVSRVVAFEFDESAGRIVLYFT
jgi:hypothetical protein